jgi:hypothetical protein
MFKISHSLRFFEMTATVLVKGFRSDISYFIIGKTYEDAMKRGLKDINVPILREVNSR